MAVWRYEISLLVLKKYFTSERSETEEKLMDMDMDYKNSSRRFRPLGWRRFKSHDLIYQMRLPRLPTELREEWILNKFWQESSTRYQKALGPRQALMKSAKIISFGLAPKDMKEKAPEASPVSSLGRLLFTSCVIRDSPFLSRAPLALAPPFACCSSVTSRDFPDWLSGYQSVISYSTTPTSDQSTWMFWFSVELWNFKKKFTLLKDP